MIWAATMILLISQYKDGYLDQPDCILLINLVNIFLTYILSISSVPLENPD